MAVDQSDQVHDLGRWRPMVALARVSVLIVVCLIPIQAAIYLLSPPPQTVLEYFSLFQRNPLLGLLDLDLLLTLDYLVMVPLYLAMFLVVRPHAPTVATLALIAGLVSVTLFVVSRDATFSMWALSSQYQTATEAERPALVASGQLLLTLYNGGTFGVSYLLGATSTLLFSWPIWRHRLLGPAVGLVGLITGATMVVPPNVGPVGLVVSLLSLVPTIVWLVLLERGFTRTLHALPVR
ncbi:DUF4386 family protein [Aestuariimicrobium sp. T2.26MG-19.2B]|uniref:DUF4386 family protein n=1 Tax=Aestuariimicrobium sp. T2.26MG-19.2B TaxID=3040679 RepID=UPI002477C097|nr:DUF4386 family protein [Aestuariimicrobium sp. T2.26MG-19.2B]CAI9407853.1 hypothetical protein AESSP_01908 [Aestuariimicrobium sp. T2.26MG-19.2B]